MTEKISSRLPDLDIDPRSINRAKNKIIRDAWVEKDKLDNFTFSAQYYDAIGNPKDAYKGLDGSRHSRAEYGRKHKKNKPHPAFMNLAEAEEFIRLLLVKWLESKKCLKSC